MMRHNRQILCSLSAVLLLVVLLQVPGTASLGRLVRTTTLDLILTIQMERLYYGLEETAKIQGNLTDTNGTAVESAKIAVEVKNPRNNTIFLDIIFSSPDGSFEDSFRIDGNAILGEYYVYSTANAAGYPITNAQVTFMVLTTATLSEKSSIESTLTEALLVHQAAMSDVAVSGNLTGLLDFTHFELTNITTGSFAGKGFSKGEWNATLEGIPYAGFWRGMLYLKPSERKIYLKGAVTGEVTGIVDGCLSETVNQSGTYDRYHAIWTIGRLRTTIVSATLSLNGTLVYQSSSEYPATGLRVLQVSVEGSAFGHYNCSLSSTLTHVEVSGGSAYSGEGFSLISYCSTYGEGEGWTYAELAAPQVVEMQGYLTSPLFSVLYATLNETAIPRSLRLFIERVDLGLPPRADLRVRTWGPERASPGETITYSIELRNDGLKTAENTTLIYLPPFITDFVSASHLGSYDDVIHVLRWDFESIPPKDVTYLSIQVRIFWGLPNGTPLIHSVSTYPKELADEIFQHDTPKLSEKQKIVLQAIETAGTSLLPPLVGEGFTIVEYLGEQPLLYLIYPILEGRRLRALRDNQIEEVLYIDSVQSLLYALHNDPEYLKKQGKTFQEKLAEIAEECNYIRPTPATEITVARDPNAKYGLVGYVSAGQVLNYTVEYENEGEGIAFGVYFTDTLDEDLDDTTLEIGSVVCTMNGSIIAGPGTYDPSTRTITWFVGEVGPGEGGYASLSVKIRNDAPDGSEIINYATVNFPSVPEITRTNAVLSVVGQPNVAIMDISCSKLVISIGSVVYVNVTVVNQGYFSESLNLTLYADAIVIETQNPFVLPGNSDNQTFCWNTTNLTFGNYTIWAYAEPVLGEINDLDNTYIFGWVHVTIPGDVDGDRDVDIFDIVRMAVIYGVEIPDSRYDPNCDIDGDGDIDIFDIVAAASHYGENW